jgi:hypothetical protein
MSNNGENNNALIYFVIILTLGLIGGLFEGAILTSEVLSTTGEKLFWSGILATFFIGMPVCIIICSKLK